MNIIARMQSDFTEKFGIPRQSGLVDALRGRIVFEPEYRNPDALRGLEAFSHIWLIWQFSGNAQAGWSPTVRPPRLGGNARLGVFATRSPFRPNPIGLSSVRLLEVAHDAKDGPVLLVSGADLMDGTPIFDIKPYVPYADSHPEAVGGFASTPAGPTLRVELSQAVLASLPPEKHDTLKAVLACDPRPPYQDDPERVYGFSFAGFDVRFQVRGDCLRVLELAPLA